MDKKAKAEEKRAKKEERKLDDSIPPSNQIIIPERFEDE